MKQKNNEGQKLTFAMICANNVNRSTEAHDHLSAAGLNVCSFGAGNSVKFPGVSANKPVIFPFGTPYTTMYNQLKQDNYELFKKNGVLSMLERDIKTKHAPQRWQEVDAKEFAEIDVVLCFEDRIFDIVQEDISLRKCDRAKPVHIICLDTKDTPEHAKIGGSLALELCQMVDKLAEPETQIAQQIEIFENVKNIQLMYCLHVV